MKRFLAATLAVVCLAPVALAEEVERQRTNYVVVREAGRSVTVLAETPEMLRERYLKEAEEFTEQLSEQGLRVLFADLREKQAAFSKDQERRRLAGESLNGDAMGSTSRALEGPANAEPNRRILSGS